MKNDLSKYRYGVKNILIYDDEQIYYFNGRIANIEITPRYMEFQDMDGSCTTFPMGADIMIAGASLDEHETIKLDETLMKRIAKFNKEQECLQLDEKIKDKKKKIKELDDLLKDKEKRWDKVKEYIANIYEIDPDDCGDDYDY